MKQWVTNQHSPLLFNPFGGDTVITLDLGTLEYFDSDKNQFVYEEGGIVRFEYSLKTLYEWEGKWKKPFMKGDLTEEEAFDFYMRMALDPIDEKFMTHEVIEVLSNYIKDTHTATKFSSVNTPQNRQNGNNSPRTVKAYTSEELYALMFEAGVPLEFENRSLNRLLVILKIISNRNTPPKKMSKQEVLRQNAHLNAQRKAKLKTRG